jgi:murein DD-endopeptidase MepM/ murein hydrolase activator NlpD
LKKEVGICLVAVACFLVLTGFLMTAPVTLPLAEDRHLTLYQAIAREQPTSVDWREMLVIDAVRFHQDFSQAIRPKVEETARLFVACRHDGRRWQQILTFTTVGESWATTIVLTVRSTITVRETERGGSTFVELLDSLDQPASGELEPGAYTLRATAQRVPAETVLDVTEEAAEATCYGRPMAEVMEELGFSPDDQQLALEILQGFGDRRYVLPAPGPGGYVWPAIGPITSPFGYRFDPVTGEWRLHTGTDIGVEVGTPVRAAAEGVVVFAGWDGPYGQVVRIDHGSFVTVYAHLSRYYLSPGNHVFAGEVVAESGSTGKSTGPHLHFEWRIGGEPVDPEQFY